MLPLGAHGNLAQLLPLLESLYRLSGRDQEQRAYMALVCLVILTQNKLFSQSVHHVVLPPVPPWQPRERFVGLLTDPRDAGFAFASRCWTR